MQKKILKKLIFWCIVFSLSMGTIVAFLEFQRINKEVKKLAFNDAEKLYEPYFDYYANSGVVKELELKQQLQQRISEGHFILLELYYNDKQKLIQAASDNIHAIKEQMDTQQAKIENGIAYSRLYYEGCIYLKVVAPFFVTANKDSGYFEGIYKVTDDETRDIIKRIVIAVSQVIVIIIAVTLLLYPVILCLNRDIIKTNNDLLNANIDTLNVLGDAIAKRDSDTHAHNYRVTIYAINLAITAELSKEQIQKLIKGAFLHDVGKIGIRDSVLLKPGKLNTDEFEIMKQHVPLGVDIIKSSQWLQDARDVVEYHHEKFDGTGYPKGVSGNNIPKIARIFSIVDVFDALTSKRPYKEPFTFDKSMNIIHKGAGKHFDPQLVEKFTSIAEHLYQSFYGVEDENYLKSKLSSLISRYF